MSRTADGIPSISSFLGTKRNNTLFKQMRNLYWNIEIFLHNGVWKSQILKPAKQNKFPCHSVFWRNDHDSSWVNRLDNVGNEHPNSFCRKRPMFESFTEYLVWIYSV